MLRLVLVFLMAYLTPVILGTCQEGLEPPTVLIDGYTVKENFDSPEANLPLGTTLVLVCSVSGIPRGIDPNFAWSCPNGPCDQETYVGRKIPVRNYNMTILAVNIISEHDNGTYTCNVSPKGCKEASENFELNVTGGKVVHSYGRLILHEGVISDRRQLQPPKNASGYGRIECRVSSGKAMFSYYGEYREVVHPTSNGSIASAVIKEGDLASGNFATEGKCAGLYHYLFLKNDTIPNDEKWKGPTVTWAHDHSNITVYLSEPPNGAARVIIGYTRLDLGVPVEGEYENLQVCGTRTFSSLVPTAKYRITAWGLGAGNDSDRRRSQSPTVIEVPTLSQGASPPRNVTITKVCNDEMELNWIPPKEPNGDILCYIITYTTQDGTEREVTTPYNINHYTLPGMVKGQNYYNISVAAFNGKPGQKADMPRYVHNPNTTLLCDVPEKISLWTITPIIINCSAGLLIEWEEPNSTSEIITYEVRIYLKEKDIMIECLNTTKKYQLVQGLETSTEYRITVAAVSGGGRADEAVDNVSTLSVLGMFDKCPSIPNIVTFNSDSMRVSESETILHIDVYRYGQMEGLIELSVKDRNGTANRFKDYVLQSQYLYFTQMDRIVEKATVVVKIINNGEKERRECFDLILSTENGDNVVFYERKMTIYIVNDDKDKKGK